MRPACDFYPSKPKVIFFHDEVTTKDRQAITRTNALRLPHFFVYFLLRCFSSIRAERLIVVTTNINLQVIYEQRTILDIGIEAVII